MPENQTPHSSRLEILSDLWLNYRTDEEFEDFMDYNDLGLPLAYAITAGIVKDTSQAQVLVDETWDLFIAALGMDQDVGFDSLDDMLGFGSGDLPE